VATTLSKADAPGTLINKFLDPNIDLSLTGIHPSNGDEIVQIDATGIVAGEPRRQATFEQPVDLLRSVPTSGLAVLGLQPHMLRGRPTIDVVLPAAYRYAGDTVLVSHRAAFDMRFLQLKEAATGVRVEQPVLDRLLMSAVLHTQQKSYALESVVERLGVSVVGRHSALGDALVTAECF